jgi:glutamate:GABA antiporter
MSELKRELGFWDLVLFHLTAIFGLRWVSIAAANGFSSITLWTLAFISFFLPQAFVLLKLSRKWPVEGGLYEWTKQALGPFHGFVSGWCYFFNNLTYYPTVLTTAAGYATYIWFSRWAGLEENKMYVFWFCLIFLWLVLILNMIGLRIGKWVQNIGGLSTWIPGGIVIFLGALFLLLHGSATPFTARALVPTFNIDTITFFSLICFAFAGFELITLLGGEIKNAETTIPRSIVAAGAIGTVIYIAGTVSLIVSLPHEKISLISGVLQAMAEQGKIFGIPLLANIIAVPLILAQFGAVGAWLAGSGRVLYAVGVDRYLPPIFSRIHPKWSTPYFSIFIQGVISSLFIGLSAVGSGNVRQFWQLLLGATLIIYFIPYVYLFIAYFSFMRKKEMPYNLSGVAACVVGLFTTIVSIVISLFPPADKTPLVSVPFLSRYFTLTRGQWIYEAKILLSSFGAVGLGILLYYKIPQRIARFFGAATEKI